MNSGSEWAVYYVFCTKIVSLERNPTSLNDCSEFTMVITRRGKLATISISSTLQP